MKVLTVAYNYPPIRGPESIQANRLIKYASEQGIDFNIVTRAIGLGNKYRNKIQEYGNIFRSCSLDNYVTKGIMRVMGLEQYPDAEVLWYPFALQKAKKLIEQNSYDYVYTRSVPFTSHLVGMTLKKSFGLPWVAHFSDPWTDSPYIKYKNNRVYQMNLNWENEVIKNADKLIFTSSETVDLILRKYPFEYYKKTYVLPHSFELKSDSKISKKEINKCTVVYAGNFYGKRTPEDLFLSLKELKDEVENIEQGLKIIIVGRMPLQYSNLIKEWHLEGLVYYVGEVSYDQCQRYLNDADVLLNIDAPADISVFLPSKVIEYFGYDKPILSIGPKKGTIARLLGEYGHINIQNDEHDRIKDVFYRLYIEGTDWIHFDDGAKSNFLPDTVACKFKDILMR